MIPSSEDRLSAVSAPNAQLNSARRNATLLIRLPQPTTTPTAIISSHCRMQKTECRMHVHICSHSGHGLFVETSRPLHPDCQCRQGTGRYPLLDVSTMRDSAQLELSRSELWLADFHLAPSNLSVLSAMGKPGLLPSIRSHFQLNS